MKSLMFVFALLAVVLGLVSGMNPQCDQAAQNARYPITPLAARSNQARVAPQYYHG